LPGGRIAGKRSDIIRSPSENYPVGRLGEGRTIKGKRTSGRGKYSNPKVCGGSRLELGKRRLSGVGNQRPGIKEKRKVRQKIMERMVKRCEIKLLAGEDLDNMGTLPLSVKWSVRWKKKIDPWANKG